MSELEPVGAFAKRLSELHERRLHVGCTSAEGRRITEEIADVLRGIRRVSEPFDAKKAQIAEEKD